MLKVDFGNIWKIVEHSALWPMALKLLFVGRCSPMWFFFQERF